MTNYPFRLTILAVILVLFINNAFGSPEVSLLIKMSNSPSPGETFLVEVTINKGDLRGISKFDIIAPYLTKVTVINKRGANFIKTDYGGKFLWVDLPHDEMFTISYELTIPTSYKGKKSITGAFYYLIEDERKSIHYHSIIFINDSLKENIIDDERNKNAFGLMMSLNMAIETDNGFDFTASDFDGWAKEAGFSQTSVMPLTGPSSAVIAIK